MNIDQYISIFSKVYQATQNETCLIHSTTLRKKRHINDPNLLVIKIMRTNYLGQNIAPTILYRKA